MTEYTPTTDDVKECYLFGQENTNVTFMKSQREHEAEFDRWLNQVRANEVRKIAKIWGTEYLNALADLIERGEL